MFMTKRKEVNDLYNDMAQRSDYLKIIMGAVTAIPRVHAAKSVLNMNH